ncbi:hypothetical protein L2E82_48133 [Cichorium intybus]|uniref:Uncharacterized protein n=1 Tax=Cichorium intybus TaxID=13427 RepID=A0ACB8YXX5_CICIN|nr:hypothetical protein L2E82_48133 [Cichorium intybus]
MWSLGCIMAELLPKQPLFHGKTEFDQLDKAKENDMSREAFLLMGYIQACGVYWGLNLPIDVVRGSRAKKITEKQFNNLPYHGLGKDFSAN